MRVAYRYCGMVVIVGGVVVGVDLLVEEDNFRDSFGFREQDV